MHTYTLKCKKCNHKATMDEIKVKLEISKNIINKRDQGDKSEPKIKCPKCNGDMLIMDEKGWQQ